jgi:hypothetical protein
MNRDFFTRKENWFGSFYELAIELQTSHDDVYLEKALAALWKHPYLIGPWVDIKKFGLSPDVIRVSNFNDGTENFSFLRLYGVLSLPELGEQIGCLSIVVRETDGSDWLDFCVPTGMLESILPVEHPLPTDNYPLVKVVDQYFLQMADMIYKQTPYDLALIGNEVSGIVNKDAIVSGGLESQISIFGLSKIKILISPKFWDEIVLDRTAHEVLDLVFAQIHGISII